MSGLASTITQVLETADQLKASGSANEANTKALLIEPVLAALGWNLTDLSEVDREFLVYDGTFLDYALKIDGTSRLFVEAKAVGKSLGDPKFISQTVNYANNEGVVWCVLTNGLSYRVYKTNEPVSMDKKLLFAVDLVDEAADGHLAEAVASLQRISRTAVAADQLDEWGERLFTDIRVRSALQQLAGDPPSALLKIIEGAVAKPVPTQDRIRASLARILDAPTAKTATASGAGEKLTPVTSAPPALVTATTTSDGGTSGSKSYAFNHHTNGKPAVVVDLFEAADEYVRSLDDAVIRKIAKMSINYFVGKRPFCSIKAMGSKVVVFLVLDPAETVPLNPNAMRDLTGIGHHGNGHVEYSLTARDQLPEVQALVLRAFEAVA